MEKDVQVDDNENADEEHNAEVEEKKFVPFFDRVETMYVEVEQVGCEDSQIRDYC